MSGDRTVLIVDDDDTSRYFKSHVLRRAGYVVSEAALGRDALDRVRAAPPALVLLDVRLPDISGIDVCRRLKADDSSVLVLQTSAAFTSSDDRATALAGGADSYLVEPIEPEELVATVGAMFRLQQAEAALRRQNETLERRVVERTHEIGEINRRLLLETKHRAEIEEQLRHAQKLDALGQLTGGIAHDFNNLLTVVAGNLERLERGIRDWDGTKQERLLRSVAMAIIAAQDCSRLTHQLLAFARRDRLHFSPVDANAAILRFEPLLRRAAGERLTVELHLAPDLGRCQADVGQLEAALLNLLVNARDAMPSGGMVQITTGNRAIDGTTAGAPADLAPGRYVCVTVADSGMGMTPDVVAHAFEPFFTTKDVGKGSGLGLSQVYGFVKQAGGSVGIETAPSAGTRIHLYLPRTEETVGAPESGAMPDDIPGGTETVLVVEDNELVLEFVVQAIRDLGYQVVSAPDGPKALDIIRAGEPIALLFTDVVMPNRMSGYELARAARALRPDLKVLITSGFSAGTAATDAAAGEFPYIAKPYALAELAQRLRSVLAEDHNDSLMDAASKQRFSQTRDTL